MINMSIVELNNENFDEETNNTAMPILIDFWADWCGPCKMMGPVIEKIAEENLDAIKVCKVNVDNSPELAQKFNIMSIPTFIVMKEGNVKATSIGVQSKEELLNLIH